MDIETNALFSHHETTQTRHVYCTWCNIFHLLEKKNEHRTDSSNVRTVQSVKLIIAISQIRNNHDVCLMWVGILLKSESGTISI